MPKTKFLKQTVIDRVEKDAILFGQVADVLGVAPLSLPRILSNRDSRLTQINVLEVISNRLGVQISDLLESDEKILVGHESGN